MRMKQNPTSPGNPKQNEAESTDLLVRGEEVHDVGVAGDAGREQWRHAVAVPLHGRPIRQEQPHDLQTARLRTVMQGRVAWGWTRGDGPVRGVPPWSERVLNPSSTTDNRHGIAHTQRNRQKDKYVSWTK